MRGGRKICSKTDGIGKMMSCIYSTLDVQFAFCITSLNFAILDKNYKDPQCYILYCFIHVVFWKRQNCRKRKYIRAFQEMGEREYFYAKGHQNVICRVMGLSHYITV